MAFFTAATTFVGGETALAQAFIEAVKPRFATAARQMSEDSKDLITAAAPVGSPSGARSDPLSSRANYRVTIVEVADGFDIEWRVVGSGAFMAKFHAQNTGSGGHDIKSSKKMPFPETGDEFAEFFAKSAYHPGTTGTHFYDDAIADVISRIQQYLV